jgi:excinuclease ABC A subunit
VICASAITSRFSTDVAGSIVVRGAREHNLKNVDVDIPRDRLVVITGLSGSGKSSLAFDTLYAEGQRRYVESLSAYARQFLEQTEKPDCDAIEGLSPAIAIEQKGTGRNPRSTVGTVTEIADYLRLLYARAGRAFCWSCEREIAAQTVQQVVDRLRALPADTRLFVFAPVVRDRKGEHRKELDELRRGGFVRVRIDGTLRELSEEIGLARNTRHTIEVLVDRLIVRPGIEKRLAVRSRERDAPRRGAGAGNDRAEGDLLQRAARLPGVRRVLSGALAPVLLVQQPPRRLSRVRRARRAATVRSRADRPATRGAAP